MPRTTPSIAERSSSATRSAVLRAAAAHNYTAERTLQALEVIVLNPRSAPSVAAALAVHSATARRILNALAKHQYVERRAARGRAGYTYWPTVRLLAMAAQLAPRLPVVQAGRRVVHDIEHETRLTAYVAVPCYVDVLVIACSGDGGVRPWATIRAWDDAAGRVLLAHRDGWRRSVADAEPAEAMHGDEAASIVERGYAVVGCHGDRLRSLAVAVPGRAAPLAALAVRGLGNAPLADKRGLIALLQEAAANLAAAEE